jgi:hypothetical protein
MLKPYICVACEKVIIDKDSTVPSLIGLLSKMIVSGPEGMEIPKDAVAPKEWCVFSIWDPEPGDELKEYMLCTQFLYPDQTQFGETSKIKIPVEADKRIQMVVRLEGFPLGQEGSHTVRTWIEENRQMVVHPIEFKVELVVTRIPASKVP